MTNKILVPAAIAAAMVVSGLALAQNTNQGAVNQPATKQSAPANAPEASGHDAQTGQPASGEAVQERKDSPRDADKKDGAGNSRK